MEKILITGAAGYLGSELCGLLLRQGYEVIGVDKLIFGINSLLGHIHNNKFKLICSDINDIENYEQHIDENTVIVHLAAIVGEPACKTYRGQAERTNVIGTKMLVDLACRKQADKFVFASTCSNYGTVPYGSSAKEETALKPLGFYAESKAEAERYIQDRMNTAVNWTMLRFATVHGLSPRPRFDLTVNDFTVNGFYDGRLLVYLPETTRPYVHAHDIARAISIMIIEKEKSRGQIYNVGDTNENYQKRWIAEKVSELVSERTGNVIEIDYIEKGEDLRDYRVSFAKIKNELGFRIQYPVEYGIKEILNAIAFGALNDYQNRNYYNLT